MGDCSWHAWGCVRGRGREACRSHLGVAPDTSSFPALGLGLLVLSAQVLQAAHNGEASVHALNVIHGIPLCLCFGVHATQGGCSHSAAYLSSFVGSFVSSFVSSMTGHVLSRTTWKIFGWVVHARSVPQVDASVSISWKL